MGHTASGVVMVTNSGGPTRENGTASDGPPRVLPPLTRLNGYILLIVSFFGFWVWIGLNALVLLLLGLDQKDPANQGPLFVGLTVCWVLLLTATLLWHAPELLHRPLGPPRTDVKGFAGYLLRHAHEGVPSGPWYWRARRRRSSSGSSPCCPSPSQAARTRKPSPPRTIRS